MAEVKILFLGYYSLVSAGRSCPTISLVRDEDLKIIVDPGTVPNQQIIIDKLKAEGLTPDDINIVLITHSHMDHYRNIGMFKNAKGFDYWGWVEGDVFTDYTTPISKDIDIIKTPGHSPLDITMLVKTKEGTVAICGDVFWQENFPEKDPFADNLKILAKSREMVLNSADFIIPGHGEMFKVT